MPTSPPILIWSPAGGVSTGPISNPPVYSQTGVTQLVEGQAYIDVVFGSTQTDDEWVLGTCEVENTTDFEPLNIWPGIITDRTTAGFRLQLNGMPDSGNYYLHWAVSGINAVPVPASTYFFSGPVSGPNGAPSTFTVRLPPSTTVPFFVTITPSDGGAGGVFSPASVALSTSNALMTFTYTPAAYGNVTLSTTNSSSILSDPAPIIFNVSMPTYGLSGPSSGLVGAASAPFTVTLSGTIGGSVTVTPNDGGAGGIFTPTTVSLTSGVPVVTFTYTPVSGGIKTIGTTNNRGLANPGGVTYTVPIDPSTIAGLKLWLKADVLALSDGTAVATWTDSSGVGNNFTQGTGANQPIFKVAIVNGKPVVRFNGTNSYMQSTTASLIPTNTSKYTIICAVETNSVGATNQAIFSTGTTAGAGNSVQFIEGSGNLAQGHFDGGGAVFVQATSVETVGAWHVFSTDWDGANIHIWADQALDGTNATATMGRAGTVSSLGYDVLNGAYWWNGDIAEILVYNSSLSNTDRQNVEAYLKLKYNTP